MECWSGVQEGPGLCLTYLQSVSTTHCLAWASGDFHPVIYLFFVEHATSFADLSNVRFLNLCPCSFCIASCLESIMKKQKISNLSSCAWCLILACSLSTWLLVLYSNLCDSQACPFPEPIGDPLISLSVSFAFISGWESCRLSRKPFWVDGDFSWAQSSFLYVSTG